jgi:hypothetical protein
MPNRSRSTRPIYSGPNSVDVKSAKLTVTG